MSTPEEIQRDIERTRQNLSADVDRLTDKVSPSKVVGRRVDSIKGTATSVKDRVMGSADDNSGLRGVGDSLGSTASGVGDAVTGAPQQARRRTQGNPLAAGMIAFGAGMLLAALLPASEQEQKLAQAAEDKASELAGPLKEKAQEVASNLQEPVQHAAEAIQSTATDAVAATSEQAKSSVADVKEPLQQH